jgi:hypothetical protein
MSDTNTGPLSAAEVIDITRFCGYPPVLPAGTVDVIGGALAPLTADHIAVIRTVYLGNLYSLETAIPSASTKLGTSQAAVWTRNPREVREREDLFRSWRLRLCWFMGIQSGPFMDLLIPAAFVA